MTSSASEHFEAVVVGAGIVGAACALELVRGGLGVAVFEAGRPGGVATAACMGHLVVMDDSPAQLELTRLSLALWAELADALPPAVEHDACGTLWLAASDEELAEVERKRAICAAVGVEAEVLDAVALREAEPELAASSILLRNSPNPFAGSTTVYFQLPQETAVNLEVFDLSGRRVVTLHDGALPAGPHQVVWNGVTQSGERAASGVYFYTLRAGEAVVGRQMLHMR